MDDSENVHVSRQLPLRDSPIIHSSYQRLENKPCLEPHHERFHAHSYPILLLQQRSRFVTSAHSRHTSGLEAGRAVGYDGVSQWQAYTTTTQVQFSLNNHITVCQKYTVSGTMLTNSLDLLNPNVDSDDESHAASVLDELTSRRSREAQKNHDVAVENATLDTDQEPIAGGAAELEEEAAGEGAFNPETGEINWDCPCLGGMAHGPCGPQFREAFSCFVYSQEEPKGMDCIERFQNMRDCFQEHPDVYKDELMEDEELDRELEAEKQELVSQIAERRRGEEAGATHRLLEESDPEPRRSSAPSSDAKSARQQESTPSASESQPAQSRSRTTATPAESSSEDRTEGPSSSLVRRPRPPPVSADAVPETEELIPKAAFDARSAENQRPPPKNA